MRLLFLFCLALLLLACDASTSPLDGASPDNEADAGPQDFAVDAAEPDAGPQRCNGSAPLCQRRFNDVAYPTVHNAMSSTAAGFRPPNNHVGIAQQLEDGVRAFMLDTYEDEGELLLCHGFCDLGSTPLADTLSLLSTWLDGHPNEVLTLIFEAYISDAQTERAFEDAGLVERLWTQDPEAPWPTLGEMIAANKRLVVLSDSNGGPAWHHHLWTHAWETDFHYESTEAFSCESNRGATGNALFILNHFITAPIALPQYAEAANFNPLFVDRAFECMQAANQRPNFITVDFYSIGDLFAVTQAINETEP